MQKRLNEKQMRAIEILARHRYRPTTEGKTTEAAINRTTAWGLVDADVAYLWFGGREYREERVRLKPIAKQLLLSTPQSASKGGRE